MKRFLFFISLLTAFTGLKAQTPEDLIRDVQGNCSSTSRLKKILQKHAPYQDINNNWSHSTDTTAFLQNKKLFECFRYKTPLANGDTSHKLVFLFATYKNDQVGYIRIENDHYDHANNKFVRNLLFKYIDTVYTDRILSNYNTMNGTDFSWPDLFEDDLDRYCTDVGLPIPQPDDFDSTGIPTPYFGLSYEIKECLPMILNKDHQAIIRYCKSFNPTRNAFGAASLYAMQKMGEPLSTEEKQLLEKIRKSPAKTDCSTGCLVTRDKKLKDILTKSELENVYRIAVDVQKYKSKTQTDINH